MPTYIRLDQLIGNMFVGTEGEAVSKRQIADEGKARADEKAQHTC
jgi:hypothetical protein